MSVCCCNFIVFIYLFAQTWSIAMLWNNWFGKRECKNMFGVTLICLSWNPNIRIPCYSSFDAAIFIMFQDFFAKIQLPCCGSWFSDSKFQLILEFDQIFQKICKFVTEFRGTQKFRFLHYTKEIFLCHMSNIVFLLLLLLLRG